MKIAEYYSQQQSVRLMYTYMNVCMYAYSSIPRPPGYTDSLTHRSMPLPTLICYPGTFLILRLNECIHRCMCKCADEGYVYVCMCARVRARAYTKHASVDSDIACSAHICM